MHFLHKLTAYHGWGMLLLRLSVGAIFLYHGIQKWAVWSAPAGDPSGEGLVNLMKFLSIVEPLGGAALVLGVLTQLAALGLSLVMVGAIYYKVVVWKIAFMAGNTTGWEFDFILLAANLAILFCGAGVYALEKRLRK